MKRYPKYKDSGVKWIGEIPQHWEVSSFGRHFSFRKGLPITKADLLPEGVAVISYGQIHAKFNRKTTLDESLVRYVSPSFLETNPQCLLKKGDFVFADTSEDIEGSGNCCYNDYPNDIFAGYHTVVASPNDLLFPKYYAYLFSSTNWRRQVQTLVNGVKVFSISRGILKQSTIIHPSLDEQQAIVAYLDEKVGKIDRYISEKEKEIVALDELKQATIANAVTRGLDPNAPLKDSGIKWIGNIPQHWEVRRIKSYFKNIAGCGFSIDLQGNTSGDYPFCKASDINGQDVLLTTAKNYVSKAVAESEKYNVIPVQSIVYSKIGEALKKNHRKITACECIVDNNCAALCIKESHRDDMDITFFYYITKSIDFSIFDNGGTIPCVNNQKLMSSYIPYPSVNEQKSIVEYLNTKTAKIDLMKDGIKSEIEKLKEYKQRLISDVVTGKVCVKGEK